MRDKLGFEVPELVVGSGEQDKNFRYWNLLLFSVFWGFTDIYFWKGVWDGVDCLVDYLYDNNSYKTAMVTLFGGTIGPIFLQN